MNNNFNNSMIAARLAALNGYPQIDDETQCQPQGITFNLNFAGTSPETATAAMKAAVYFAQHPEMAEMAETPAPAPLPAPTVPEGPTLEERIAAAVGAAVSAALPAITAAAAAPAIEQAKAVKQQELEQVFAAAVAATPADAVALGNKFATAKAALATANSIQEINAIKF